MEKFKKLTRTEMKNLVGGQRPCTIDAGVKCDCNGAGYQCAPSTADCIGPNEICEDFCGGPFYAVMGNCWDSSCGSVGNEC